MNQFEIQQSNDYRIMQEYAINVKRDGKTGMLILARKKQDFNMSLNMLDEH